jgi:hypothetical protein
MSTDIKDIKDIKNWLSLKPLLMSVVCLIALYFISVFVRKVIIKLGKKKREKDDDIRRKKIGNVDIMYQQIALIVYYSMLVFGTAFILSIFYKVQIYGILGLLSIFVYAMKSELSNIWCGMIMIMNGIYRTGDFVTIKIQNNSVKGRIVAINFFYTKLSDVNTGSEITISNNLVYHSAISTNDSEIYDQK